MTIRQFAKEQGHEVVGQLIRKPDWEESPKERWYIDEADNEYCISRRGICIITAEGAVI